MNIILLLGIINLLLVFLQLLVGLQVFKLSFRVHKVLGIILCVTAALHALIAIIEAGE